MIHANLGTYSGRFGGGFSQFCHSICHTNRHPKHKKRSIFAPLFWYRSSTFWRLFKQPLKVFYMTFPTTLQTDDPSTDIAAAEALRASSTAVYISDRSKASQSKQIQAFYGYSRERVTRAYAVRVYNKESRPFEPSWWPPSGCSAPLNERLLKKPL